MFAAYRLLQPPWILPRSCCTRVEHQISINSWFFALPIMPRPMMAMMASFLYTSMRMHQIEQSMCLQVISNFFSSHDSPRPPLYLTLSLWDHVCTYTRQSIAVALTDAAHEIPRYKYPSLYRDLEQGRVIGPNHT